MPQATQNVEILSMVLYCPWLATKSLESKAVRGTAELTVTGGLIGGASRGSYGLFGRESDSR